MPNPSETMVRAYLECAIWSTRDEHDQPYDRRDGAADRITAASYATARVDLGWFLDQCEERGIDLSALSDERIGMNVWLNREGHGAGFQDDGIDEARKVARFLGSGEVRRVRNGWISIQ